MKEKEWNPEQYLKFEKERTLPCIDLMMRIEMKNPDKIIDMGCGPGNSTLALKSRWPKAYVAGIDNSESMLAKARENFSGIEWIKYDISGDLSKLGKFDIVFSNAALQWVADKTSVLKNMFDMLNDGGILAVQVPYPVNLPFKAELQKLAVSSKWEKYFAGMEKRPEFYDYQYYYDIISRFSESVSIWKTDYIQVMTHEDIIEWDKGTGARPYIDALVEERLQEEFLGEYLAAVKKAYPLGQDKKVLVPFPRIFFTAGKAKKK